ncbi:Serine/threonine-protein phosphatase 6 regulatory ankyrin repeat subunit A [Colletotrichum viniferum]|nr:Serine/threonine-protein phosphatase 6 regulatory ankyrin repeat subunit A [Colletotrichum viniferum]
MCKHASSTTPRPSGLALLDLPVSVVLLIMDKVFENSFYHEKRRYISSLSGYDHIECIDENEHERFRAFDHWKDLSRMAASCKAFYNIITPILYRQDVLLNHSSALLLSAKKGNLRGLLRSIQLGQANPDKEDHTNFWHDNHDDGRCYGSYERTRGGITSSLTALHFAAYHGHPLLIDALLEHGANADKRADMGPNTELESMGPHDQVSMFCHTAAEFEEVCGLNIDNPYKFGANVLFFALKDRTNSTRKVGMVKRLIQAGASLITRERGKIHALHQACASLDLTMAKFLIKGLGVDPNLRDEDGNTPLHFMAMDPTFSKDTHHLHAMFCFLVGEGADIDAENFRGLKPLHHALFNSGCIELACLLTDAGAEFDERALYIYEGYRLSDADRDRVELAFVGGKWKND